MGFMGWRSSQGEGTGSIPASLIPVLHRYSCPVSPSQSPSQIPILHSHPISSSHNLHPNPHPISPSQGSFGILPGLRGSLPPQGAQDPLDSPGGNSLPGPGSLSPGRTRTPIASHTGTQIHPKILKGLFIPSGYGAPSQTSGTTPLGVPPAHSRDIPPYSWDQDPPSCCGPPLFQGEGRAGAGRGAGKEPGGAPGSKEKLPVLAQTGSLAGAGIFHDSIPTPPAAGGAGVGGKSGAPHTPKNPGVGGGGESHCGSKSLWE